jgi:hypothetical protein
MISGGSVRRIFRTAAGTTNVIRGLRLADVRSVPLLRHL